MAARESDPFPWLDPEPRGMIRFLGGVFVLIVCGATFGAVLGVAALIGGVS